MSPRALIAEPSVPVAGALRKFLEGAGFEVKIAVSVEEALQAVRLLDPSLVFGSVIGGFEGEALCARLRELAPDCPVVLVYSPEEDNAETRASAAGAEACLVGPIKRGTVVSIARVVLRIRDLQLTVHRLEADLEAQLNQAPQGLKPAGVSAVEPKSGEGSAVDFEFFNKFLLMEVKRSRRYRYPIAVLLVGVDHLRERLAGSEEAHREAVLGEIQGALTRALRDIDLLVPHAESRFLVLLPHTGREGALAVASRLQAQVARGQSLEGLTGSVGVSAFDPSSAGPGVDFATLLGQASQALERAQLAGGDRVEASPSDSPKRDRISMG